MSQLTEKYSVPAAIIIAGLFVAGAVMLTNFYSLPEKKQLAEAGGSTGEEQQGNSDSYKNAKSVSQDDHILGNKNAKVKVVTYSDMECPYCISFKDTMRTLVAESDGKVAWVYRHFPLDFHEFAMPAAVAAECSAEIGGEEKFFEFMEKFTVVINSGKAANMPEISASIGIDKDKFSECFASDRYNQKIADQFAEGTAAGLEGTPYSVVFADDSPVSTINGAFPKDEVRKIIDQYLK